MNLLVNTIIEWYPASDEQSQPQIERVLWVDASATEIIAIKLFDKYALPIKRLSNDIAQAIRAHEARILKTDPHLTLLRPESEISEASRRCRDGAWDLIEGLVMCADENFLTCPKIRGPLVTALAETTGSAKRVIYKYLRCYWQGGGMKNALLPAFDNCGGRGKRRLVENSSSLKLGRKSALAKATGSQDGVGITSDIERRFEKGIKKFYETADKFNLKDAYDLTIEKLFNDGYTLVGGVPTPLIPPKDTLPTLRQFRYWYENVYRNIKREKISREGAREYNLRGRELLGDSTQMSQGPGSIYQIDATISDVYLEAVS
jgi:hypothetical protein